MALLDNSHHPGHKILTRRPAGVRPGAPARRARPAARSGPRRRRSACTARRGRETDGPAGAGRRRQRPMPTRRCGRRRSSCCATSRSRRSKGSARAESLAGDRWRSPTRRRSAGIAKNASRESTALRALARVTTSTRSVDRPARGARAGAPRGLRRAARPRGDADAVALNSDFKDPTLAAVERISDRGELDQIAARARNKSAAKRARAMCASWRSGRAAEPGRSRRGRGRGSARSRRGRAGSAGRGGRPVHARARRTERAEAERLAARRARHGSPRARTVRTYRADAGERRSKSRGRAANGKDAGAARAEQDELPRRFERAVRAAEAPRRGRDVERRRARLASSPTKPARPRRWRIPGRPQAVRRRSAANGTTWAPADQRSRRHRSATPRRRPPLPRATRRRTSRIRRRGAKRWLRAQQLVGRIEAVAARTDLTLKAGERALKEIRTALSSVPQLPSKKDYDEIVERLKAAQTALMPKVQELRDVADWQRWANVGIQEQLCEKMEALKSVDDPEAIAKQVRELQQQWRQAADVPRAQGEALWKRFKAAHDEAWTRCEAHFAAQAEARARQPGEEGRALRTRRGARRLDQLDSDRRRDQEAAGGVEDDRPGQPRPGESRSGSASARACDRFFTRRHADLAERKTVWADNLAKKEALCAQGRGAEGFDRLGRRRPRDQTAAGRMEDDRSGEEEPLGGALAALPRRRAITSSRATRSVTTSRAANGSPRARRSAPSSRRWRPPARRKRSPTAAATRRSRRSPIERPSRSEDDGSPSSPRAASIAIARARSTSVSPTAFAAVLARWPSVFGGTDLDPDANRKKMETIVQRIEELAKSLGGPASAAADAALSPTTRLAAMLKEALAANTIGGKADDDSRLRAAGDEVRQAQATLSRIGPVPDEVRRALADRFQRATRRISDATQQKRPLLADLDQLDVEHEHAVRRLLALVGELLGNPESRLLAFEHQLQALGPARR